MEPISLVPTIKAEGVAMSIGSGPLVAVVISTLPVVGAVTASPLQPPPLSKARRAGVRQLIAWGGLTAFRLPSPSSIQGQPQ